MKRSIIIFDWHDDADHETIEVKTEEIAQTMVDYFLPYGVAYAEVWTKVGKTK